MELKFWLKRLLQLLGLMCGCALLLVLTYRSEPKTSLMVYMGLCAIAQIGLESNMYRKDFPVMLRFGSKRIPLFLGIQILRMSGLVMSLLLQLLSYRIFDSFGNPEVSVVLNRLLASAFIFILLTSLFSIYEKLIPNLVAVAGMFLLAFIARSFPAFELWYTLAYGAFLCLMAIFADRKNIMNMEV